MVVAYVIAKRHNYPTGKVKKGEVSKVLRAVPSVLLIVIIIGGILTGLFTAIEVSNCCRILIIDFNVLLKTVEITIYLKC